MDIEAFRAQVRELLERDVPSGVRGLSGSRNSYWGGRTPELPHPDSQRYCALMAERGFTAPTWPKEYGGAGLDKAFARVLDQERARLNLPVPLTGFGLSMIGPVLLQFGTEEQKREHLPRVARGEIRWCQGYSEPDAGSDLAAIRTTARQEAGQLVINGQKVWTSYGEKSDWMFALVRTAPDARKQEGITFVLLDLKQPGVEVRTVRLISGASPFCETFFTDAHAELKNVVNGLNNGWTVAKALLVHERNMLAGLFGSDASKKRKQSRQGGKYPLAQAALQYLGEEGGRIADPVLRDRVTQVAMDQACFQLTVTRSADYAKAGQKSGPESSIFKIYGTELNQRRHEVLLSIRGANSLGWEGPGFHEDELEQTREWLRSRGNTIEGGTSEIQLNIIAKRVLELPE